MTPTEQDKELDLFSEEALKIAEALRNKYPNTWSLLYNNHVMPEVIAFITADRKRVALEAAIMGAKFGNAAIRQHNIANPTKPMNLDAVRDSGIQQAKAWAEQQC